MAPKVDRLSNPSLDNLKFDLSDDDLDSASIADSETSVLSDGRFVRSEEKVAAVIAKLKSASEKVPGTGSASEVLERLSVQVDKNKPQLNTTKAPNPEVTNQVNIPQAAKPAVTEEVTLVVKTDHVKTLKERREAPSSKGPGPAALK